MMSASSYEVQCLDAYERECDETLRKLMLEYVAGVAEWVDNENK